MSPRKRMVFHFDCRTRIADAPLTIDTSGVYFRPEGPNYIAGSSPREGTARSRTRSTSRWIAPGSRRSIWPAIAHRVPAFEAIRLLDAWAGHYEVNTLDHNAVIGPHPDLPNFLFANGFSGHGLQQAPAAGRGAGRVDRHRRLRDDRHAPARLRADRDQPADTRAERHLTTATGEPATGGAAPRPWLLRIHQRAIRTC